MVVMETDLRLIHRKGRALRVLWIERNLREHDLIEALHSAMFGIESRASYTKNTSLATERHSTPIALCVISE